MFLFVSGISFLLRLCSAFFVFLSEKARLHACKLRPGTTWTKWEKYRKRSANPEAARAATARWLAPIVRRAGTKTRWGRPSALWRQGVTMWTSLDNKHKHHAAPAACLSFYWPHIARCVYMVAVRNHDVYTNFTTLATLRIQKT